MITDYEIELSLIKSEGGNFPLIPMAPTSLNSGYICHLKALS